MTDGHKKGQAAMEFLSTHGFSIMIVMIVLIVLVSYGFFNSNTFTVKASPGGCSITRPNGAWNNQYINTGGTCTSLQPQDVLSVTSGVTNIIVPIQFNGTGATLSYWVEYNYIPKNTVTYTYMPVVAIFQGSTKGFMGCEASNIANTCGGTLSGSPFGWNPALVTPTPYAITWYNVVLTNDNNGNCYVYIDGVNNALGTTGDCAANDLYNPATNREGPVNVILNYYGGTYPSNMFISNVQLYNIALAPGQVESLYLEGVGGDPLVIQSLGGWWPLNGNLYDYSGNGDNGTSVSGGLSYTSSWQGGYTTPTEG